MATDIGGRETSQTVVVTVTNVNEAPVAGNDTLAVDQPDRGTLILLYCWPMIMTLTETR